MAYPSQIIGDILDEYGNPRPPSLYRRAKNPYPFIKQPGIPDPSDLFMGGRTPPDPRAPQDPSLGGPAYGRLGVANPRDNALINSILGQSGYAPPGPRVSGSAMGNAVPTPLLPTVRASQPMLKDIVWDQVDPFPPAYHPGAMTGPVPARDPLSSGGVDMGEVAQMPLPPGENVYPPARKGSGFYGAGPSAHKTLPSMATSYDMQADPFAGLRKEIIARNARKYAAEGSPEVVDSQKKTAELQDTLNQMRGGNREFEARIPRIQDAARKRRLRDELDLRRAKLGASVGSYQNPELMHMSNEQQIADKLAAQRGGAAPGQKVDPRWQLGGLSVSGQRPTGAGATAGGDPLERVHQLVQENRPMGPDALRQRQLHLMGMTPPSQDRGASRKTHGKYGGGPVHRGESVATLPGQGYRDQKTRIALHGPSSEYAMNRDGLDESEKALVRDAALKQKQEATSNASRIAQKVKLNRQASALNNARQMAGSVDPRRQYQSQMILERQIREGANANGGNDPLQAFIRTTNQLGLPQHLAAPLIAQHQKYLNEMELERQKAFANIEAGKAGGQIPKDYQNPFGKPVGAAGLPQDAGLPVAANQPPGETKRFKSFRDRLAASQEIEKQKEIDEENQRRKDAMGLRWGAG